MLFIHLNFINVTTTHFTRGDTWKRKNKLMHRLLLISWEFYLSNKYNCKKLAVLVIQTLSELKKFLKYLVQFSLLEHILHIY